ncbi:MAG: sortase [Chloroflexi bacterium]|nr:sortase [Chloroflexota bacterium]
MATHVNERLARYGGRFLIALGIVLLFASQRSAAGPAGADREATVLAPVTASGVPNAPARLIASPRRSSLFGGVPANGGEARADRLSPRNAAVSASETPATYAPSPSPSAAPQVAPTVAPAADSTSAGTGAAVAATDSSASQQPAAPPPLGPTDRIVIPRTGLDAKVIDVGVLPSGEMATAAYAAGRLVYSPQAGEAGNAVIAGHNDTLGEVFRRLPELRVGDQIVLYRGERAFRYVVETRVIVREDGATEAQRLENARWMHPTVDAVATLISCYPYRVDTHRVIVRARLI